MTEPRYGHRSPKYQTTLVLDHELWERLGAFAKKRRTSKSSITRVAVEEFLDRNSAAATSGVHDAAESDDGRAA